MESPASIPTQTIPQSTPTVSFWKKHRFTLASVFILLLALIPLIILSQKPKSQPKYISAGTALPTTTPTPTPMALTSQQAVPTITTLDQNIQTSLNEANSEMNAASQIDTSQDSTSGL